MGTSDSEMSIRFAVIIATTVYFSSIYRDIIVDVNIL
jgi:hypothetical protein